MAVALSRMQDGIKLILALFCFGLVVSKTLAQSDAKVSPFIAAQRPLWRFREADVDIYRIPLISYTPGGRLLAVAEARKHSGGDAGPKFIAIRRSVDELGNEWEPMQFIVDDGYLILDGLNLGNILVDDEKGIIFIMYCICYHHNQCSKSITKIVKSFDDGVTWSKPIDLTDQIGSQPFAPGPGFAIQKKLEPFKGRLISCGHGGGMFILYSDDHGLTWKWGGALKNHGNYWPDECQAAEMPDGSIMLNIRNQKHYNCSCRIIARSFDGGLTFPAEDVHVEPALIEPACAAGLLFHRDILFFSNPRSATQRINLTLQWSYNNGTTWTGQLPIWDKASGYSSMTAHPGSSKYIFMVFEKGTKSYSESIEFVRISMYADV